MDISTLTLVRVLTPVGCKSWGKSFYFIFFSPKQISFSSKPSTVGQEGWDILGATHGGCWLCGDTLSSPFPGPLMQVLVTIMAPIYWSLAQASGAARSGFQLTQGTFQHESLLQFATGEGKLTGEPAQLLGKLRLQHHP